MAGSKCPGSRVVVGGYSQGSAAVAAALGRCGEGVRKQVVGTVCLSLSILSFSLKYVRDGGEVETAKAPPTTRYSAALHVFGRAMMTFPC